jgi:adenylosuccinate synthase
MDGTRRIMEAEKMKQIEMSYETFIKWSKKLENNQDVKWIKSNDSKYVHELAD